MVFRVATEEPKSERLSAWKALAQTQRVAYPIGYISQPGHALLAGALAANLSPEPFGILPAEVIDTISKHDTGWAMPDLDALEHAVEKNPESFIDSEVPRAVAAWTRSIYEAEKHTTLAGILTSRHFCLLAPRDGNAAHQEFFRSETGRREDVESRTHFPAKALDRYTAALGFCDLLSLCLCSGLIGDYDIPLAHHFRLKP